MNFTPPVPSQMSVGDLKRLVKTGEGTYLEFKRIISSPEKIARELAAFANTRGGTMLIGVDDDKRILGVESFYEQDFLLDKAINYCCIPPLQADVETVTYKDRDVIIVKVKEAEIKPVYVEQDGRRFVYVREKDKSMQASREVEQVLKNMTSTSGITFEYGPNEQRLFRYLNEYQRITVKEYSNLVNISPRRASRILVNLVSAGVLRLFSHERREYFTLTAEPV
ncbi:MAG: ATP-binding protein [Bacteroidetes bacterium]|nr:ATP-binding protein [Bacteroidota bacterium]MCH8523665.1 ATP-binding protein [Balneolales bacterium]